MVYDSDAVSEKTFNGSFVVLYRFIVLLTECFDKKRVGELNLDFFYHGRKSEIPLQDIIYSYHINNKDTFPYKNYTSSWDLYKENLPYGTEWKIKPPDFSFIDLDSKWFRWEIDIELKYLNNPKEYSQQLKTLSSQLDGWADKNWIPVWIVFHSNSYNEKNDRGSHSIQKWYFNEYYPLYLKAVEKNMKGYKRYKLVDTVTYQIPGWEFESYEYFIDMFFPEQWIWSVIVDWKTII